MAMWVEGWGWVMGGGLGHGRGVGCGSMGTEEQVMGKRVVGCGWGSSGLHHLSSRYGVPG